MLETEECNTCGGFGFNGGGTGYDSVCDNCGGKGELPKEDRNYAKQQLAEKFGLVESVENYTLEDLYDLVNRNIYLIIKEGDNPTVIKKHKGYVTGGNESTIYMKIREDDAYRPVKKCNQCEEVKRGIYHDSKDKTVYYCTIDSKQYADKFKRELDENETQPVMPLHTALNKLTLLYDYAETDNQLMNISQLEVKALQRAVGILTKLSNLDLEEETGENLSTAKEEEIIATVLNICTNGYTK